jgi:hypothetical protein
MKNFKRDLLLGQSKSYLIMSKGMRARGMDKEAAIYLKKSKEMLELAKKEHELTSVKLVHVDMEEETGSIIIDAA